jgi:hypothetical protein
VIANTASNVVLARAANGTTTVVAGKSTPAIKAPAARSPGGLHLYLVPTVTRLRRGCRLSVGYRVGLYGRAEVKLGAKRSGAPATIRYPGGTFRGGTVNLRPGTYAFRFSATDKAGRQSMTVSGKVVVLKQRCRG